MKKEQSLRDAFDLFDKDHSGLLGKSEIQHLLHRLGQNLSDEDIVNIMRDVDEDDDGMINFDEFRKLFARLCEESASDSVVVPDEIWKKIATMSIEHKYAYCQRTMVTRNHTQAELLALDRVVADVMIAKAVASAPFGLRGQIRKHIGLNVGSQALKTLINEEQKQLEIENGEAAFNDWIERSRILLRRQLSLLQGQSRWNLFKKQGNLHRIKEIMIAKNMRQSVHLRSQASGNRTSEQQTEVVSVVARFTPHPKMQNVRAIRSRAQANLKKLKQTAKMHGFFTHQKRISEMKRMYACCFFAELSSRYRELQKIDAEIKRSSQQLVTQRERLTNQNLQKAEQRLLQIQADQVKMQQLVSISLLSA